jgi:hypothetical protein
MAYQISSGEIAPGVLYLVIGEQSVTYNSATYIQGQVFRGIIGAKTFTYSGLGSQGVNEVLELSTFAVEYIENSIDQPLYTGTTLLKGMSIELTLNDSEKTVPETTKIQGFALELIDYPFFSFEITEIRI